MMIAPSNHSDETSLEIANALPFILWLLMIQLFQRNAALLFVVIPHKYTNFSNIGQTNLAFLMGGTLEFFYMVTFHLLCVPFL